MSRPLSRIAAGFVYGLTWLNAMMIAYSANDTQTTNAMSTCQVYFGTYTGSRSRGIYHATFDQASGQLSRLECAAEIAHPSFLAWHPTGRWLYAVNETSNHEGKPSGAVSAFARQAETGTLTLLNQQPTQGGGPCHLCVDQSGRFVIVANYGGGSVCLLPIRSEGALGPAADFIQHQGSSVNRNRQQGPHAHGVVCDRANQYALVADLGLDRILTYRLDATAGKLISASASPDSGAALKPGAGPRHLAFHPNDHWVYVINELDNTITVMAYEPSGGKLRSLQTISTLPENFSGASATAEVVVHPSGRFVYGSNRGHDSIVVFRVNPNDGRLSLIEHESTQGKNPRNFALDPSGRWLLAANQDSDSVVVFRVDPSSGTLQPAGSRIELGKPVCVLFAPIPAASPRP